MIYSESTPALTYAPCARCHRYSRVSIKTGLCLNCSFAIPRVKTPPLPPPPAPVRVPDLKPRKPPYLGTLSLDEYRERARERMRRVRAERRHLCATPGCTNQTRATFCQSCAAHKREDRIRADGRKTQRGQVRAKSI